MSWIFIEHRDGGFRLYTVGFYAPDGTWHTDSDYQSKEKAAARINYLNGGADDVAVQELRNSILEIAAPLQVIAQIMNRNRIR